MQRIFNFIRNRIQKKQDGPDEELKPGTLRYNIEKMTAVKDFVCISGWAWSTLQSPEELRNTQMHFTLTDAEGKNVAYKRRNQSRPDVAKVLYDKDLGIEAGFHILFLSSGKFPYRLTLQDDAMKAETVIPVLQSCETTEPGTTGIDYETWWNGTDTLRYNIESVTADSDLVCISGWAWSTLQSPEELRNSQIRFAVTDADGQNIPYGKQIHSRHDVAVALYDKDLNIEAGFHIFFLSSGKLPYRLILQDDAMKADIEIADLQKNSGPLDPWIVGFDYETWWKAHSITASELQQQRESSAHGGPLISVLVPIYHTPEVFLREMIASVQAQSYPNWELCLADGSEEDPVPGNIIRSMALEDARIRYLHLEKNLGISGNSNASLGMANGEWIALLDHDDLLEPNALWEAIQAMKDPLVDAIYSDEDKIDRNGEHPDSPNFKPDYNEDYLLSCNYIAHLFLTRTKIARAVQGFHSEFDGSQDHDLILRCTEKARKIVHIPKVLYHWRMHPASTSVNTESKTYCFDAGKRAIEAFLHRHHLQAEVAMLEHLGWYRVTYFSSLTPKISILIPSRDKTHLLKTCLNSIFQHTAYPNFEICILDHGSVEDETFAYYQSLASSPVPVRILSWKKEGNVSAMHNWAVKQCDGELLLFLSGGTEVITSSWLEHMCADCMREGTSAVGAKLLHDDSTIAHAGFITGLGGIAGSPYVNYPDGALGFLGTAMVKRDVSAVSAACMMVRREIWEKVQGMDEQLALAYHDIDFCLKIRQHGGCILFDPDVRLFHHASGTHSGEGMPEQQERLKAETAYMQQKWSGVLSEGDPYYSPNFSYTHAYRLNTFK